MSEYIKYFENGSKNMSFLIKDDYVLDKYNEIWDKIKETLNIKFHSLPDYDEINFVFSQYKNKWKDTKIWQY